MKLEAVSEFPSRPRDGAPPKEMHVLARLSFPEGADTVNRPPLHLALVLDRSGSMAGDKIRLTKECACRMARWLTRRDFLAVVAYDSAVDMLVTHTPLTDKAFVEQRIMTINHGGGTNLSGGWLRGLGELREHRQPNHLYRLILLTDGQANEGIVEQDRLNRLAAQAFEAGIATTTIGFGADFNEDLLNGIAASGGGRFHYVDDTEALSKAFQAEFGSLATLVAHNVELKFHAAAPVKAAGVLAEVPTTEQDGAIVVRLGDACAGDGKTLLVKLGLPAQLPAGPSLPLGRLSARCDSLAGDLLPLQESVDLALPLQDGGQVSPNAEVRCEVWLAQSAALKLKAPRMLAEEEEKAAIRLLRQHVEKGEALEPAAGAPYVKEEIRQLQALIKELEASYDPGQRERYVNRLSKVMTAVVSQQTFGTGVYRRVANQLKANAELTPRRPEEAEDVIAEATGACRKQGFAEERVERVNMVLRELIDNGLQHGCKDRPDGVVKVDCLITENYARCVVHDDGPGFDYEEQLKREEEEQHAGNARGRGLLLIARGVDRIEVDTSSGTRVEVVIYRQGVDIGVRRRIEERSAADSGEFAVSSVRPADRGVVVVTVNGRLDVNNFRELEETFNDLFGKAFYRIIVDLAGVEYISSAGAGVFLSAHGEARQNRGDIVLARPSPAVEGVFALLGFDRIFKICGSVEEAQEFFA